MKQKVISALIVLATITALAVVIIVQGDKTERINTGAQFFTSPSDTSIKINGTVIELDKTKSIALTPGTYDVEFIRVDFKTKTDKFDVVEGQVTEVPVALDPLNESGQFVLDNQEEAIIREGVLYRISVANSKKMEAANPLTSRLPVSTTDFRIDYGVSEKFPDDRTKVAYIITTESVESRKAALDWLRSQGIDPDTLEIIYRFF